MTPSLRRVPNNHENCTMITTKVLSEDHTIRCISFADNINSTSMPSALRVAKAPGDKYDTPLGKIKLRFPIRSFVDFPSLSTLSNVRNTRLVYLYEEIKNSEEIYHITCTEYG